MNKINPKDLDENYELKVTSKKVKKPARFKLPKENQQAVEKRKLTKIARRNERLANRKRETNND